jgi:hypothetical protein
MLKKFFVGIINVYQKYFSRDHSKWGKQKYPHGHCRFYPSCSEYMKQGILKHGSIIGILKGIWRVLRCNPFNKGGIDNP